MSFSSHNVLRQQSESFCFHLAACAMAGILCSSCVENFLEGIGLEKYNQRLRSQGYENAFDLCLLSEDDLDMLRILDSTEREKILEAAAVLDVDEWLRYLDLHCYVDGFRIKGINTVRDVKNTEINEDLLDALEITVPGHRKRLRCAASSLQWHNVPHKRSEKVVVVGYWGQPPGLEGNQNPFLCVPGYLKSEAGEDGQKSKLLQFIVDSGSEVVTATESLIRELGLKYLHEVESRGAHSATTKPIYKGYLRLGTEDIEVEVMPENQVSSIGNVVMRKFSHYINGTYHRWLKNDPAIEELPS